MDTSTVITLLTVNLIVLSLVIVALITLIIILLVKLNKVANNIQQTTSNVANITEWFSPVKVFGEIAKAITSIRKK